MRLIGELFLLLMFLGVVKIIQFAVVWYKYQAEQEEEEGTDSGK